MKMKIVTITNHDDMVRNFNGNNVYQDNIERF